MIKPIFSEKSLALSKIGRFTFRIDRNLNKHQVRSQIKELFDVTVTSVSTMNYKGGSRRTIRGKTVKSTPYKKAIVMLKAGQTINLWDAPKTTEPKKSKAKKQTKE